MRWLETVYLPRCQTLPLHQMYEAMELEVNLVFYDTTTISFSIDIADEAEETGSDSALRQYGRPKDGRWSWHWQ